MLSFLLDLFFGCRFGCYGGYIENGKFICARCGKVIQMNQEKKIRVRFYFTNGESDIFYFTEIQWEETKKYLLEDWSTYRNIGDKFGINYTNVMYYVVEY